ncbi:hypothetical protein [Microbulbifer litoralis]|uniref:hypothetical protein n=1 Tax=Microbulbifer litoralis TaxID=2933965 RepID=UPI002029439F|nr:hypothetical protein [Microbulbifer sp. GX H0434]
MNTLYQLKQIPERFMALQLDVVQLADQLGDIELLDTLMQFPASNEPLSSIWKDSVSDDFQPLSLTSTEIPDISLWDATCLVLNEKAFNALNRYLKHEGEFLPITANGEKMHIFNCQAFGKEDKSLTVKKYVNGTDFGLEHLAFDEDDVAQRFVFKSEMKGCNTLYCTSSFKALCKEFSLEGLRFDGDLVSPF